jgi:hypothetical protein
MRSWRSVILLLTGLLALIWVPPAPAATTGFGDANAVVLEGSADSDQMSVDTIAPNPACTPAECVDEERSSTALVIEDPAGVSVTSDDVGIPPGIGPACTQDTSTRAYCDSQGTVRIDGQGGNDTIRFGPTDSRAEIVNLIGGAGDDTIVGSNGSESVYGGPYDGVDNGIDQIDVSGDPPDPRGNPVVDNVRCSVGDTVIADPSDDVFGCARSTRPPPTPPTSAPPTTSNPVLPLDADGDGVSGSSDSCPAAAGPSTNSGCPVNRFSFAGKALVKKGFTLLKVTVPGRGVLKAAQAKLTKRKPALIKAARVSASKAGTVKLKLKPTKAGKKLLAKKGKFSVKIKVTFTPTGGKRKLTVARVKLIR